MAFTRAVTIHNDVVATAAGTVTTDWVRLPTTGGNVEGLLTLEVDELAGTGATFTVTVQTSQDPDGATDTTTGTSTLITPIHAFTAVSSTTRQHLEILGPAGWSGSVETLRAYVRLSILVAGTGATAKIHARLWVLDQ